MSKEAQHPAKDVTATAHAEAVHAIGRIPEVHGLTAPCATTYKAKHHSGKRDIAGIKWIVMHSTEGDSALGAAAWFGF